MLHRIAIWYPNGTTSLSNGNFKTPTEPYFSCPAVPAYLVLNLGEHSRGPTLRAASIDAYLIIRKIPSIVEIGR